MLVFLEGRSELIQNGSKTIKFGYSLTRLLNVSIWLQVTIYTNMNWSKIVYKRTSLARELFVFLIFFKKYIIGELMSMNSILSVNVPVNSVLIEWWTVFLYNVINSALLGASSFVAIDFLTKSTRLWNLVGGELYFIIRADSVG